jgi:hypothetical protein
VAVQDETFCKLSEALKKYLRRKMEYEYLSSLLKGINYTNKDIANFSIGLNKFENYSRFSENTGIFLSALVNNCNANILFRIFTRKTQKPILHLGLFLSQKSLTVWGPAGDYAGERMKGGALHIHGEAGDFLGSEMEKGVIRVDRKVGSLVGNKMKGGLIQLWKEFTSLSGDIYGGSVLYRKTMLISDGHPVKVL